MCSFGEEYLISVFCVHLWCIFELTKTQAAPAPQIDFCFSAEHDRHLKCLLSSQHNPTSLCAHIILSSEGPLWTVSVASSSVEALQSGSSGRGQRCPDIICMSWFCRGWVCMCVWMCVVKEVWGYSCCHGVEVVLCFHCLLSWGQSRWCVFVLQ